ncbi:MAG: hypothetical protein H7235_01145 [Bdellovibrionaceae bacterium]|nr:hypothetical protein [Pseudobdellovibrionaceae bacterium]
MKKNKKRSVKKEEALLFLEDMQKMQFEKDEPTVPISLRIPANIIRSLKAKAKIEDKKYQSLIISYIRKCL